MKYLSSEPFSVGGNPSKAYEDGWDAIFKSKPITDWDKHMADCNAAADAALAAEPVRAEAMLAILSSNYMVTIRRHANDWSIQVENPEGHFNTYFSPTLQGAIELAYEGNQS